MRGRRKRESFSFFGFFDVEILERKREKTRVKSKAKSVNFSKESASLGLSSGLLERARSLWKR
jgi:hypothetical protein